MSRKKKNRSLDQHPGPTNPDCAKAIRWSCSDSNERQTLEPLYIQMSSLFKCCQVHNQKTLLQNRISYLILFPVQCDVSVSQKKQTVLSCLSVVDIHWCWLYQALNTSQRWHLVAFSLNCVSIEVTEHLEHAVNEAESLWNICQLQ